MNARSENSAAKDPRGRGASQSRSGMQRLIPRWVYRHLRLIGGTQLAGGGVAAAVGAACLWYGGYGWGAFFLVIAALDLASGSWYLTIARSRNRGEAFRPQS